MGTEPKIVDSVALEGYAAGAEGDGGIIKRVIGRPEGSTVLLGHYRMTPGQRAQFTLPSPTGMEQETYFVLAGRLAVRWSGEETEAGPGQAIFFPTGDTYEVEAVGSDAVEVVWTGYPAP